MSKPHQTPTVTTGLLDDFPIERLLVFLEACGAQGRLALTGGFDVSIMYLQRGMVVHAHDSHGAGFDALSRTILGEFERFSLETGVRAPETTLSGSNAELILKVMRRRPPSPRLSQTYGVPATASVHSTRAASSHRAPVTLSTTEASILSAVAGTSAVAAVAEAAGIDLTLTRHVLMRLASAGFVTIVTEGAGANGRRAGGLSPVRRRITTDLLRRLHPAAPLGFRVSAVDARVYELIDGSRSLDEIGGLLGLDASVVGAAIERLEDLGLVTLRERGSTAAAIRTPLEQA